MAPISKVIVVGAGPAGLILSLLLSKAGIPVQVVDAAKELDNSPRATHYSSPSIYELRRAGILDDVRKQGFIPSGVQWRKINGDSLGGLDMDSVPFDNKMVCLPLNKLIVIVKEHLDRQSNIEILWSHKVVKIDQDDQEARVVVETPNGEKTLSADYIVYYDMTPYNWGDANFIIDPEDWSMVSKIGTDGLLRITYGEKPGLTRDELIERQPMKFKKFLPGRPDPDKYKIVNISPYRVHQRLAKSLRVGRFLLAADAAHLCNPFGGLGLTGGLVDIGNLYDCLYGVHKGLADETILDRYSEVRREKYLNVIDPVSSENIRRLWQDPEKALETDVFLQMCQKAATDPEVSRQIQMGLDSIMHDFTKEYRALNGTV